MYSTASSRSSECVCASTLLLSTYGRSKKHIREEKVTTFDSTTNNGALAGETKFFFVKFKWQGEQNKVV